MSVKNRIRRLEDKSELGVSVSARKLIEKQANEMGIAPSVALALSKAIRARRLPAESETA